MDLQLIIALNVMTISAMVIAATLVYRQPGDEAWLSLHGSWLAVHAVVLAGGAAALWLVPELAGTIVTGLFIPLALLPVLFFHRSQTSALAGRTAAAARWATAAALTHPTTSNWMNAKLLAATAAGERDDGAALQALVKSAPPQYRGIVQAHLALNRRDWNEILALAVPNGPADSIMKPLEIRALGETGQTEAMIRCYWASLPKLTGAHSLLPKLVVLAFGGRPVALAKLLAEKFPAMTPEYKTYWSAIANLNSGANAAAGQRALDALAATAASPATRSAAQRQLAAMANKTLAPLAIDARVRLDAVAAQVMAGDPPRAKPVVAFPVTLALIVLNSAAFAAEIFKGGAEDSNTLISLGALWPQLVLEDGQWWRLLTACFLHFGALHIISNMLVLFVLGRLLEPLIGWLRFSLIYLASGVASSAFVLLLMESGATDYALLVGASGAIFGLLGAEVMIVLLEWWRSPATFDKRRLTLLGMILGLQIVMDLSIPNVSFAAHASGFLTGLLLMLLLSLVSSVLPGLPNGRASRPITKPTPPNAETTTPTSPTT